jgi:hypothetical protein
LRAEVSHPFDRKKATMGGVLAGVKARVPTLAAARVLRIELLCTARPGLFEVKLEILQRFSIICGVKSLPLRAFPSEEPLCTWPEAPPRLHNRSR